MIQLQERTAGQECMHHKPTDQTLALRCQLFKTVRSQAHNILNVIPSSDMSPFMRSPTYAKKTKTNDVSNTFHTYYSIQMSREFVFVIMGETHIGYVNCQIPQK